MPWVLVLKGGSGGLCSVLGVQLICVHVRYALRIDLQSPGLDPRVANFLQVSWFFAVTAHVVTQSVAASAAASVVSAALLEVVAVSKIIFLALPLRRLRRA